MIRIQNFNFIMWKFLQMSKLLCSVLKVSGGQMPQMHPHGCAPVSWYSRVYRLQR